VRKAKVVLYGMGEINRMVGRLLFERGYEIVGAVDIDPTKVGKDVSELIGVGPPGVSVSSDAREVLRRSGADLAVIATTSFLREVYEQLMNAIESGVNVISTCEELAFPELVDPSMAKAIDERAKEFNVRVLGTGVNPGFIMDLLLVVLAESCARVRRILMKRSVDALKRRPSFQRKIGIGLTDEEFWSKLRRREITAHVGLEQSVALVARALGWGVPKVVTETEPIIARKGVPEVQWVIGVKQKAIGIIDEENRVVLELEAYTGAEEFDEVVIDGEPSIHMRISPCIHGDLATSAIVVNTIPRLLSAKPGLLYVTDIPIGPFR